MHITKLWVVFLLGLVIPMATQARQTLAVGVYDYPPFYQTHMGKADGVIPDVLHLLNQAQSEVEFVLYATTARRRYKDFQDGKFDLLLFENRQWGWQDYPVHASETLFSGGEVWVTMAASDRDQSYFKQLQGKTLVGVLGYHYGFADLDADPHRLHQHFGMQLVDSQDKVMELLLQERADMGLVAYSFINRYLHQHPELKPRLLISDTFDQQYQHGALLREDATITIEWLNSLFSRLKDNGQLRALWHQHHLLQAPESKSP